MTTDTTHPDDTPAGVPPEPPSTPEQQWRHDMNQARRSGLNWLRAAIADPYELSRRNYMLRFTLVDRSTAIVHIAEDLTVSLVITGVSWSTAQMLLTLVLNETADETADEDDDEEPTAMPGQLPPDGVWTDGWLRATREPGDRYNLTLPDLPVPVAHKVLSRAALHATPPN